MSGKKKIMLFADWYEPGFKAGGPIRSCVNFVEYMHATYDIYVFTSDRDLNAHDAYKNIIIDAWHNKSEGIRIYYCSPQNLNWKNIKDQFRAIAPDFIYLNSMFSKYFTIYPLLINKREAIHAKVILSPRGMLRSSALKFKSSKKKIFLDIFRIFRFHRNVLFHAADETEKKDILENFGNNVNVAHVPNFPGKFDVGTLQLGKHKDDLSMLFVGRIHPIKNLDYLLRVLGKVKGSVQLTIVGSIEDKSFWQDCQILIDQLPKNISVSYKGEMPNHLLPAVLKEHHIFSLPTKGENFGHAIFEALSLGKPVLISDQTPWKNLQPAKAGWSISLQEPEKFVDAIKEASNWDQDEYNLWSLNAFNFAKRSIDPIDLQKQYQLLFS